SATAPPFPYTTLFRSSPASSGPTSGPCAKAGIVPNMKITNTIGKNRLIFYAILCIVRARHDVPLRSSSSYCFSFYHSPHDLGARWEEHTSELQSRENL